MKRLNKTQTKLMQRAKESRRGTICITSHCGHGGDGGVINCPSTRESNAACQLRDMGLLVFVKHEHSRDVKNGWSLHTTDAVFELTEAGKAYLAGDAK